MAAAAAAAAAVAEAEDRSGAILSYAKASVAEAVAVAERATATVMPQQSQRARPRSAHSLPAHTTFPSSIFNNTDGAAGATRPRAATAPPSTMMHQHQQLPQQMVSMLRAAAPPGSGRKQGSDDSDGSDDHFYDAAEHEGDEEDEEEEEELEEDGEGAEEVEGGAQWQRRRQQSRLPLSRAEGSTAVTSAAASAAALATGRSGASIAPEALASSGGGGGGGGGGALRQVNEGVGQHSSTSSAIRPPSLSRKRRRSPSSGSNAVVEEARQAAAAAFSAADRERVDNALAIPKATAADGSAASAAVDDLVRLRRAVHYVRAVLTRTDILLDNGGTETGASSSLASSYSSSTAATTSTTAADKTTDPPVVPFTQRQHGATAAATVASPVWFQSRQRFWAQCRLGRLVQCMADVEHGIDVLERADAVRTGHLRRMSVSHLLPPPRELARLRIMYSMYAMQGKTSAGSSPDACTEQKLLGVWNRLAEREARFLRLVRNVDESLGYARDIDLLLPLEARLRNPRDHVDDSVTVAARAGRTQRGRRGAVAMVDAVCQLGATVLDVWLHTVGTLTDAAQGSTGDPRLVDLASHLSSPDTTAVSGDRASASPPPSTSAAAKTASSPLDADLWQQLTQASCAANDHPGGIAMTNSSNSNSKTWAGEIEVETMPFSSSLSSSSSSASGRADPAFVTAAAAAATTTTAATTSTSTTMTTAARATASAASTDTSRSHHQPAAHEGNTDTDSDRDNGHDSANALGIHNKRRQTLGTALNACWNKDVVSAAMTVGSAVLSNTHTRMGYDDSALQLFFPTANKTGRRSSRRWRSRSRKRASGGSKEGESTQPRQRRHRSVRDRATDRTTTLSASPTDPPPAELRNDQSDNDDERKLPHGVRARWMSPSRSSLERVRKRRLDSGSDSGSESSASYTSDSVRGSGSASESESDSQSDSESGSVSGSSSEGEGGTDNSDRRRRRRQRRQRRRQHRPRRPRKREKAYTQLTAEEENALAAQHGFARIRHEARRTALQQAAVSPTAALATPAAIRSRRMQEIGYTTMHINSYIKDLAKASSVSSRYVGVPDSVCFLQQSSQEQQTVLDPRIVGPRTRSIAPKFISMRFALRSLSGCSIRSINSTRLYYANFGLPGWTLEVVPRMIGATMRNSDVCYIPPNGKTRISGLANVRAQLKLMGVPEPERFDDRFRVGRRVCVCHHQWQAREVNLECSFGLSGCNAEVHLGCVGLGWMIVSPQLLRHMSGFVCPVCEAFFQANALLCDLARPRLALKAEPAVTGGQGPAPSAGAASGTRDPTHGLVVRRETPAFHVVTIEQLPHHLPGGELGQQQQQQQQQAEQPARNPRGSAGPSVHPPLSEQPNGPDSRQSSAMFESYSLPPLSWGRESSKTISRCSPQLPPTLARLFPPKEDFVDTCWPPNDLAQAWMLLRKSHQEARGEGLPRQQPSPPPRSVAWRAGAEESATAQRGGSGSSSSSSSSSKSGSRPPYPAALAATVQASAGARHPTLAHPAPLKPLQVQLPGTRSLPSHTLLRNIEIASRPQVPAPTSTAAPSNTPATTNGSTRTVANDSGSTGGNGLTSSLPGGMLPRTSMSATTTLTSSVAARSTAGAGPRPFDNRVFPWYQEAPVPLLAVEHQLFALQALMSAVRKVLRESVLATVVRHRDAQLTASPVQPLKEIASKSRLKRSGNRHSKKSAQQLDGSEQSQQGLEQSHRHGASGRDPSLEPLSSRALGYQQPLAAGTQGTGQRSRGSNKRERARLARRTKTIRTPQDLAAASSVAVFGDNTAATVRVRGGFFQAATARDGSRPSSASGSATGSDTGSTSGTTILRTRGATASASGERLLSPSTLRPGSSASNAEGNDGSLMSTSVLREHLLHAPLAAHNLDDGYLAAHTTEPSGALRWTVDNSYFAQQRHQLRKRVQAEILRSRKTNVICVPTYSAVDLEDGGLRVVCSGPGRIMPDALETTLSMDALCGCCFGPLQSGASQKSAILQCSKCHIKVHLRCRWLCVERIEQTVVTDSKNFRCKRCFERGLTNEFYRLRAEAAQAVFRRSFLGLQKEDEEDSEYGKIDSNDDGSKDDNEERGMVTQKRTASETKSTSKSGTRRASSPAESSATESSLSSSSLSESSSSASSSSDTEIGAALFPPRVGPLSTLTRPSAIQEATTRGEGAEWPGKRAYCPVEGSQHSQECLFCPHVAVSFCHPTTSGGWVHTFCAVMASRCHFTEIVWDASFWNSGRLPSPKRRRGSPSNLSGLVDPPALSTRRQGSTRQQQQQQQQYQQQPRKSPPANKGKRGATQQSSSSGRKRGSPAEAADKDCSPALAATLFVDNVDEVLADPAHVGICSECGSGKGVTFRCGALGCCVRAHAPCMVLNRITQGASLTDSSNNKRWSTVCALGTLAGAVVRGPIALCPIHARQAHKLQHLSDQPLSAQPSPGTSKRSAAVAAAAASSSTSAVGR